MGEVENQVTIKPLASWKTWWTSTNVVGEIASALHSTLDPTKFPGGGKLVELKSPPKVSPADLDDCHTSRVVEVLLVSFPASKEASAYLLGDVVMKLNSLMGNSILGPQKANPLEEASRRDLALKQGGYLKLLLSYVRNSSSRTNRGRTPSVTFLKELALSQGRPNRKSGKLGSPSGSDCSTASAETLLLDGRPISALDPSPPSSSRGILDTKKSFVYLSTGLVRGIIHHRFQEDASYFLNFKPISWPCHLRTTATKDEELDVVSKTLMLLG